MPLLERQPPVGKEFSIFYDFEEARSPDFTVNTLLEITPDLLRARHIELLILDAEGTFVEQGFIDPDPQLAEHIRMLKTEMSNDAKPLKIAVVTNKVVKDPASFITLANWGQEIEADTVITPLERSWRKPSPRMIFKAMRLMGLRRDQAQNVLMVGDKRDADDLAGNTANTQTVEVVEIVGQNDLIGDRLIRRPYERFLRRRNLFRLSPFDPGGVYPPDIGVQLQESSSIPQQINDIKWWSKDQLAELPKIKHVIYGYDERGERTLITHQKILGSKYLYRRGGEVADNLGDARIRLAIIAAIAEMTDEYLGPRLNTNFEDIVVASKTLGAITDFLDGWLARRSERGATAEGAKRDTEKDKIASIITQIGMYIAGNLSGEDLLARWISDVIMTYDLRPFLEDEGIDTSAVLPGKVAMAMINITDVITPVIRKKDSKLADIFDRLSTIAKEVRLEENEIAMRKRHDKRKTQLPYLQQAAVRLQK